MENESWNNCIYLIGGPGMKSYGNKWEKIIKEKQNKIEKA